MFNWFCLNLVFFVGKQQPTVYAEPGYIFFFILGGTPYPKVKGRDVYSLLKEGYRIEKPSHVDNEL